MAFPTTAVIDDFNRANGNIGAGWGIPFGATTPTVDTNIVDNGNGPYAAGYRSGGTFGADSEAFCTFAAGSDYFGVHVRVADPTGSSDGYQASWSGSNLTLQRNDNGASTQLGSTVSLAKSVGDKLGLEAIGTAIKVYTVTSGGAWTQRISQTDATYGAAGFIAFDMFESGTIGIDDFGGGTVVGGGGAVSILPLVACDMRNMADMGGMRG